MTWSTLPHLKYNEWWTKNCVAAVSNTIVAGPWSGSDLYTFDNSSEEWVTHKGVTLSYYRECVQPSEFMLCGNS